MSELQTFRVSSPEEAATAFDYFNGFHDGFMKRIDIASRDVIDEDHGQSCTGLFDVEIEFAHYNYSDGEAPFHPYNQIVHAVFRDVQDIFCDFREGFLGNTDPQPIGRPRKPPQGRLNGDRNRAKPPTCP